MSNTYLLAANAKTFSSDIVGEQFYPDSEQRMHDLAAANGGRIELQFTLVPEPDNPYDDHAISVRYQGMVVGYIPRDKNRRYWTSVTRIQASGLVPIVRGQAEAWSNGKSASVKLALGGKQLVNEAGLKPNKRGGYTPGPAYIDPEATTNSNSKSFSSSRTIATPGAANESSDSNSLWLTLVSVWSIFTLSDVHLKDASTFRAFLLNLSLSVFLFFALLFPFVHNSTSGAAITGSFMAFAWAGMLVYNLTKRFMR